MEIWNMYTAEDALTALLFVGWLFLGFLLAGVGAEIWYRWKVREEIEKDDLPEALPVRKISRTSRGGIQRVRRKAIDYPDRREEYR